MTEEQRAEHNRAFEEAAGIVNKEVPFGARGGVSAPGWLLRRKLVRALALFERVLELNPANWSAFWMKGKLHWRMQEPEPAFACLEQAHRLNPAQPEVARQASLCALDLGRTAAAVSLAQQAVQSDPNSAALRANLALACLLAGRLPDARLAISQALAGEPGDPEAQRLNTIIQHFIAQGATPPGSTGELAAYCARNSLPPGA